MDKPKVGPKDFFLWAGAIIALYTSIFSFISLFFTYVDAAFPDALNYSVDPYSAGMRSAMASLIVMFPLFLFLMSFIRKDIISERLKADLWVRRWALVFTIFIAGLTIAIDLVVLVNYFLGGELTTRFVLKVLVVLLVAAGGLMHFLADIWGYWFDHQRYARMIAAATAVLVVLSIAAGFLILGTPGQVRKYRFDDQKTGDLQNLQYGITNYWQQHRQLPASLDDLKDPLSGYVVPVDPQTGQPYIYTVKGPLTFQLCASFNAVTQPDSPNFARGPVAYPIGKGSAADDWLHTQGQSCFSRTIDPERYPPTQKDVPADVPAQAPPAVAR